MQAKRLDAWSEAGTDAIRDELLEDYQLVAIACGDYRIYHKRSLERPELRVDCTQPFDELVLSSRCTNAPPGSPGGALLRSWVDQ